MEPVPATRTVQRTVRLAVALLIGQVVLVAFLGWLTFAFSSHHSAGSSGTQTDLAAPFSNNHLGTPTPAESAAPSTPHSSNASRQHRKSTGTAVVTTAADSTTTLVNTPTTTPAAPAPPTVVVTTPAPTPSGSSGFSPHVTPTTTAPSPPALSPPSPSSSAPVVQPGDRCRFPFATAKTGDGITVRCLPDPPSGFRWEVVR